MEEVSFNISKDGHHLFRTDWYATFDLNDMLEISLIAKFPRTEGYKVTKAVRHAGFRTTDVN